MPKKHRNKRKSSKNIHKQSSASDSNPNSDEKNQNAWEEKKQEQLQINDASQSNVSPKDQIIDKSLSNQQLQNTIQDSVSEIVRFHHVEVPDEPDHYFSSEYQNLSSYMQNEQDAHLKIGSNIGKHQLLENFNHKFASNENQLLRQSKSVQRLKEKNKFDASPQQQNHPSNQLFIRESSETQKSKDPQVSTSTKKKDSITPVNNLVNFFENLNHSSQSRLSKAKPFTPTSANIVKIDLTLNNQETKQKVQVNTYQSNTNQAQFQRFLTEHDENVKDSEEESSSQSDQDQLIDKDQSPIQDELLEQYLSQSQSEEDQCNHIDTQQDENDQRVKKQQLKLRSYNSKNDEELANSQIMIPATPVHTFGNLDFNQKISRNENIFDKDKIIVQLNQEDNDLNRFSRFNLTQVENEVNPKSANKSPQLQEVSNSELKSKTKKQKQKQNQSEEMRKLKSTYMKSSSSQMRDESKEGLRVPNTIEYLSPGLKVQKDIYQNRDKFTTSNLNPQINTQDYGNWNLRYHERDLKNEFRYFKRITPSKSHNVSPNRQSPYQGTIIVNPTFINTQAFNPQNNQNMLMYSSPNQYQRNSALHHYKNSLDQNIVSLQNNMNSSLIFTPSKILLNKTFTHPSQPQQNPSQFTQQQNQNQDSSDISAQRTLIQLRKQNQMLLDELAKAKQEHKNMKIIESENKYLKDTIKRMQNKQESLESNLRQAHTEKMQMHSQIQELTSTHRVLNQTIQSMQSKIDQLCQNHLDKSQEIIERDIVKQQNNKLSYTPQKPHEKDQEYRNYRSHSHPPQKQNQNKIELFDNRIYGPTDIRLRESPTRLNENHETISYRPGFVDEMQSSDLNDFQLHRLPRQSILESKINNNFSQFYDSNNPEMYNYITYQKYHQDINNGKQQLQTQFGYEQKNSIKHPLINKLRQIDQSSSEKRNSQSGTQEYGNQIIANEQDRSKSRRGFSNAKNQSQGVSQALQWQERDNQSPQHQNQSQKSFSPSRVEADEFDSDTETYDQSIQLKNNEKQNNQYNRRQSHDIGGKHKYIKNRLMMNQSINVNQVREIPIQRNVNLFSNMNSMNRRDTQFAGIASTLLSPSNFRSTSNNGQASAGGVFDSSNNDEDVIDITNYKLATKTKSFGESQLKTNSQSQAHHNFHKNLVAINRSVIVDQQQNNNNINSDDFQLMNLEQRRDQLEREYSKYLGYQSRSKSRQKQASLEQEIQQVSQSIHQLKHQIKQQQQEDTYKLNQ
eukprot:403371134